jgi:hypothetical protein
MTTLIAIMLAITARCRVVLCHELHAPIPGYPPANRLHPRCPNPRPQTQSPNSRAGPRRAPFCPLHP